MSTTMARSPFSTAAFAQLVRRLRHTNARYNQIALQFRCRIRPTHHAKRRAHRAGLCIDTSKARACPAKYISTHPPPVLDCSPDAHADAHATHQDGACMRGNPPGRVVRKQRRRDGRQRIMLRLPPLKLHLNIDCASTQPFHGPVPGAPRLLPSQLPDDACGMEEMMLASVSPSSSSDGSDSLLTPYDVRVYSGLCITIPPAPSLKRKLHDVEPDDNTAFPRQPKRFLKARWDGSQSHWQVPDFS